MTTTAEIVAEVVILLKKDMLKIQIRKELINKGVEENEINIIIGEAEKIYNYTLNNRKKIKWLSILLFTIVLFYFFIPVDWSNLYSIFLSFVGGILVGLFFSLFIVNWKLKDGSENAFSAYSIPIAIVLGIIFLIVFYMHFRTQHENELLKNGQLTTGIVMSGEETTTRSIRRTTTSSELKVKFWTKEGQEYLVNADVSWIGNFQIGQKVDLIYSKNNPLIFALLTNDENIKKYTGSAERSIIFKDLLTCLDAGVKNLKTELDKIQLGWIYNAKDSIWTNESRNSAIKFTNNQQIQFISAETYSLINSENCKEFGFKTEIANDEFGMYESEKYKVVTRKAVDESNSLSIISIEKK
jgi:hypothetical protein